jgi:hypothetical protein
MNFNDKKHSELILGQFSKQAVPLSNIPGHTDEKISNLIISFPFKVSKYSIITINE